MSREQKKRRRHKSVDQEQALRVKLRALQLERVVLHEAEMELFLALLEIDEALGAWLADEGGPVDQGRFEWFRSIRQIIDAAHGCLSVRRLAYYPRPRSVMKRMSPRFPSALVLDPPIAKDR